MSAEIIALNDAVTPTPEKRHQDIVELFEAALTQAKNGEIDAAVIILHRPNQEHERWWSGPITLMLGLVTACQISLAKRVIGE